MRQCLIFVCLIIISYQQNQDFPLIVAANRDEFYARPTAALDWWANSPQILGGADISQSIRGAWLGTNRHGRFAAITNFRDPGKDRKDAASRGLTVRRYLEGGVSTADFVLELVETASQYNGFNLLFGTKDELWYYGNRSGEPPTQVSPGLHVLSNALLDTPWPKTLHAAEKFQALRENPPDAQSVFDLLADRTQAGKSEVQRTGLPLKYEIALSSIFIAQKFRRRWFFRSVGYGTRASSYLTFSRAGEITFHERTWINGKPAGDKAFRFMSEAD
ncbi:MAG: NRDE family protein [Turneriella sp.]